MLETIKCLSVNKYTNSLEIYIYNHREEVNEKPLQCPFSNNHDTFSLFSCLFTFQSMQI